MTNITQRAGKRSLQLPWILLVNLKRTAKHVLAEQHQPLTVRRPPDIAHTEILCSPLFSTHTSRLSKESTHARGRRRTPPSPARTPRRPRPRRPTRRSTDTRRRRRCTARARRGARGSTARRAPARCARARCAGAERRLPRPHESCARGRARGRRRGARRPARTRSARGAACRRR